MSKKLPRETLRDLRLRSGLSAAEIARLCQYKSTNGYIRYEYDGQCDKLIPYTVVKQLIPILVGRGTPPIKVDELIAISEARGDTTVITPKPDGMALEVVATALRVRYRVERGVYRDEGAIAAKQYGPSPLLANANFEPGAQWAATDADADKFTVYHCVDLEQVPSHRRKDMRCICKIERERSGLYEIAVTKFNASGRPDNGTPIGVVIAVYTME